MSDFFKQFLLEDPRRLSPGGRFVGLAAFGKHPGWDDHIEDLGLETESLNIAKTALYMNGIGGQIDSGAWEKLDAAQQLPNFNHLFVWQRSGQILVGRLWSSSEGKGRTRYPMVVCLHLVGVTLGWALKQALPALAELEEGCVQTTLARDVRGLLDRKRAALREAIESTNGRGEYAPVTPEALYNILQPSGESKREGFFRVLYQIQSQLGGFAPGKFNGRGNLAALRAQQIRVPAAGKNPEQALLFWSRFFLTQVDAAVPLLLTLPLEVEGGWVDVTVGEPASQEFFCLRASPKAVPMVSEVPFTLDDTFRAKAAAFLEGFQRGETTTADLQPAAAAASVADPHAPAKSGWRTWLGVGAVVIIGAVAAMVLLPKVGNQQAKVDASDTRPKVANPVAKTEVAAAAAVDPAKLKAQAETLAKEKERQIAEANRLAQEKEAARQKDLQEQKYRTAMKDGQGALDRKDYAQAITLSGVALDTKSNDPAATKLRTDAQRQLDLVNNAQAQEQKYQTAMKDGQSALDRKDYAQAITLSGVALDAKSNDPVATKLRTEAQRQLDLVSTAKAQEQKYHTAMKDGQSALDRKDYARAITLSGVALETKSNDPAATKLRTDAQRQLDLVSTAKAQEQKYHTAMKDGQSALDRKDYAQAITLSGVALDAKSNDPVATKLRTEAQRQLDLVSTAKAQEQKYQTAMKDGQSALDRKDYAQAITLSGVALDAKSNDPVATKLRSEAQRQLDLVNTAKAQEQKYQTAMSDGQSALERKDFAAAITKAGLALEIKANDPAASALRTEAQRQLDLVNAEGQKVQNQGVAKTVPPPNDLAVIDRKLEMLEVWFGLKRENPRIVNSDGTPARKLSGNLPQQARDRALGIVERIQSDYNVIGKLDSDRVRRITTLRNTIKDWNAAQ